MRATSGYTYTHTHMCIIIYLYAKSYVRKSLMFPSMHACHIHTCTHTYLHHNIYFICKNIMFKTQWCLNPCMYIIYMHIHKNTYIIIYIHMQKYHIQNQLVSYTYIHTYIQTRIHHYLFIWKYHVQNLIMLPGQYHRNWEIVARHTHTHRYISLSIYIYLYSNIMFKT